jgi:hypothetical protein
MTGRERVVGHAHETVTGRVVHDVKRVAACPDTFSFHTPLCECTRRSPLYLNFFISKTQDPVSACAVAQHSHIQYLPLQIFRVRSFLLQFALKLSFATVHVARKPWMLRALRLIRRQSLPDARPMTVTTTSNTALTSSQIVHIVAAKPLPRLSV